MRQDWNLNDVTQAPDVQGPHGRAWRCDLDAAAAKAGIKREDSAQIEAWIIEARWAHPFWHSYLLTLVHLRPMPDGRRTLIYQQGVTHELTLFALNPDHSRGPVISGQEPWRWLEPCNFAAQIIEASDEAARTRIAGAVREIVDGVLSPDTDFLSEWVKRFGGNMIKRDVAGNA